MVLGRIPTNRLINCCSDMSTIMFSDQSSVFFYILQWASIKYSRTLDQKIAAVPRIVLDQKEILSTMIKTKISSRAKHPGKTQTFVRAVQAAMENFDDEIGSLTQDIHLKAYKNLVQSYRTALTAVWDLAQFTDISLMLETVHDKDMLELAVMAQKSDLPPPSTQVIKEKRKVLTLDTITGVMIARYPDQDVPNAAMCEKIGDIFLKLSKANKAYGEVAEALAELSTQVSPQHYMLLLTAATAPTIQVIVPPNMTSPVVAPPPPLPQATTALGRTAIVDATKLKVLPNPEAQCLRECDNNTPTRVLAAAIYAKLEKKFFNTTHSRIELATAFRCNVSQLTKALTGVEYKSGPHHYKPKPKPPQKWMPEEGETSGVTPEKMSKAVTRTKAKPKPGEHMSEPDDTLESESSSNSDLPAGL